MREEKNMKVQMNRNLVVNRHSMFLPKSKGELFYDYPELRRTEEFKTMAGPDILFAFFIGHQASPFVIWGENESKRSASIDRAYHGFISKDKYNSLLQGNYTDKMRDAIEKMRSYKLGARIRILKIAEAMLENWESIAKIKIDPAKIDADALKEYKGYVDATEKILKNIPELLERVEESYSISINEEAEEESEMIGVIDMWHEEDAKFKIA